MDKMKAKLCNILLAASLLGEVKIYFLLDVETVDGTDYKIWNKAWQFNCHKTLVTGWGDNGEMQVKWYKLSNKKNKFKRSNVQYDNPSW